jgi:hypothetical protein
LNGQGQFDFDGNTYEPELDRDRLGKQFRAVFTLMQDARWRTLGEIEAALGFPQASISARLRDFRKQRFGAHEVLRRRRGEAVRGLFEYQLLRNR